MQTGTLDELRHLTRTTIRAVTTRPVHGLEAIEGVHHVVTDGATVTFDVDSADLDAAVLLLGGCGVTSLTSHPPTLEELFLRHYGDELSERGLTPDDTHPR